MPDDHVEDLRPHDRRRFFREGLARALRPMADFIEQRVPEPVVRTKLRPPGALPEDAFLATCYRCGSCSGACPAEAIQQSQDDDVEQVGTPYVDPDIAACVVCESLACMNVCPSGALSPIEPSEIEMGLAEWQPNVCLLPKGRECNECFTKCPRGEEAIRLNDVGQIEVIESGCIGCGVCQHHCPATPKAIVVRPSD